MLSFAAIACSFSTYLFILQMHFRLLFCLVTDNLCEIIGKEGMQWTNVFLLQSDLEKIYT